MMKLRVDDRNGETEGGRNVMMKVRVGRNVVMGLRVERMY